MKLILSFAILASILSAGPVSRCAAPASSGRFDIGSPVPNSWEPVSSPWEDQETFRCGEPVFHHTGGGRQDCAPPQPNHHQGGDPWGQVNPGCPPDPHTSAAPEPASYALLGAGLLTAGVLRRMRKKA